jgi:hypothetical protein
MIFAASTEEELAHLVVGQLPNRDAETQDGLFELFRTEHCLTAGPRDAAQFADPIPAGKTTDVRVREQDTAAARDLFRRHVEEMAKRRPNPAHPSNCPTKRARILSLRRK